MQTTQERIFAPHAAACGCSFDKHGDDSAITLCPLHAAAPELLAALKALYNAKGPDARLDAARQARAAIDKAEVL